MGQAAAHGCGEMDPFCRDEPIIHGLAPDYAVLRSIRTRSELMAHPRYPIWKQELDRVLPAIEQGTHGEPRPPSESRLRVAAWNIQRGARFEALIETLAANEMLREADVLFLEEVDNGMARSGHRNVARELAASLHMHYGFGVSYLVLGDDLLENAAGEENTLALAGNAMLSKHPFRWLENVDLPEIKDKFSSRSEKRLGKKRALMAGIDLPSGPLVLACCHLDSNASPAQRALQADFLLQRAFARGDRVLLGGDLNTTTYNASGFGPLMFDLVHKFFHQGFDGTVRGYMKPEESYEKPLFRVLEAHGMTTAGFNDRDVGTFVYDMSDPYTIEKLHVRVGRSLTWLLDWRLRPYGGVCPAKLDWFAGRGIDPLGAWVVEPARIGGIPASDHACIVVDLVR